jgi:hypothetical protein
LRTAGRAALRRAKRRLPGFCRQTPRSRLLGDETGPPSPAVAGLGSAFGNGFPSAPRHRIQPLVGRKGCAQ